MGGLGGFGALFDPKAAGFTDPVLVATTDGVGTKLRVAIETGLHDTVGIDLVAMCVNDLVVQGAEPLFFLDYFATGKLAVDDAARVIGGIAEGCRLAGCALVGGETAEMPGMYAEGDYDLAGFAVGAAERGPLLPATARGWRRRARPRQRRRAFQRLLAGAPHRRGERGRRGTRPAPFAPANQLAAALMAPTRIYVKPLLALHRAGLLRAAAHITGGGLPGNVPRVLPPGTRAVARRARLAAAAGVRLAGARRRGGRRRDAARVQLRHRHGPGRGGRRWRRALCSSGTARRCSTSAASRPTRSRGDRRGFGQIELPADWLA